MASCRTLAARGGEAKLTPFWQEIFPELHQGEQVASAALRLMAALLVLTAVSRFERRIDSSESEATDKHRL